MNTLAPLRQKSCCHCHTMGMDLKYLFTLWWQQHFCVIAIAFMNGFNTHSWWQWQQKKWVSWNRVTVFTLRQHWQWKKLSFLVLSIAIATAIWINLKARTWWGSGCGISATMGLKCFATAPAAQNGVGTHLLKAPLLQLLLQVLVWMSPLVTMESNWYRHCCRSCCRSVWTSL